MLKVTRTNSYEANFISLVEELDSDLFRRYPEIQHNYVKLNKVDFLETVVLAYFENKAIGCGCFKVFDKESVEIKRMYVKSEFRGRGISKVVIAELISWAIELGYKKAILETGSNQPEAIGLYEKFGFIRTENFGNYKHLKNSICFAKILTKQIK
jgi:putative acetyltransferase